jgi:hypothetical protein
MTSWVFLSLATQPLQKEQLIEINFSIYSLIDFFIIAINLFRSNYWLLFAAMAVYPTGVGVSISSPLELGGL